MPKFGPVAPIQVLEGLFAHSPTSFGNYHLLLAHHTVEHQKRFSDLFQRVSEWAIVNGDVTVIMDNSIVELGNAVDTGMIQAAVEAISFDGINVIPVLPDVMGQGLETRVAVEEAYPIWDEVMGGVSFMVVCQGNNFQDYLASLHYFADKVLFPKVEVLGIPRVLTKLIGTRIRAALSAKEYEDSHKIHFLGFSDNITDDIDSVKVIPTSGIDSAVPLRVREIFSEFTEAGKRPTDWFETAQVDVLMIENLAAARQLFGDQY